MKVNYLRISWYYESSEYYDYDTTDGIVYVNKDTLDQGTLTRLNNNIKNTNTALSDGGTPKGEGFWMGTSDVKFSSEFMSTLAKTKDILMAGNISIINKLSDFPDNGDELNDENWCFIYGLKE